MQGSKTEFQEFQGVISTHFDSSQKEAVFSTIFTGSHVKYCNSDLKLLNFQLSNGRELETNKYAYSINDFFYLFCVNDRSGIVLKPY